MVSSKTQEGLDWAIVGWADVVEVYPDPVEEDFYLGDTLYKTWGTQSMSLSFRLRPDEHGNLASLLTGQSALNVDRLISKHFPS